MKTLSDIGEDALIERLIKLVPQASGAAGPGDDCAVMDSGNGWLQLLKTDALVENIHYLPQATPRAVGWKSIARVISDFAAMGGVPEHFLVTLALPPTLEISWVEDFYKGIGDCLETFGATLAGGETSCIPAGSSAVISIAATGRVRKEHLVLRSTGKPGQTILVTGTLGGSITGKHLAFTPRIKEAAWLVRHFKPSAMMDLSDGLGKDLPRLAAASQVGFILDEKALPLSSGCTPAQAIGDGEDFELLLTMEAERVSALLEAWRIVFPDLPLTPIGHLVAAGEGQSLQGGWEHFS